MVALRKLRWFSSKRKASAPHEYYANHDLDAFGAHYVTDKSSIWHNYLGCYEFFLSRFRHQQFTLMEIGINEGVSLRTWRDYFPKAHIVGLDINDCRHSAEGRITVEVGDASDAQYLLGLQQKYAPLVIVDDASHRWTHQIIAFETLFPNLPKGGVYICEDIQTSFEPLSHQGFGDSQLDAFTYFMRLSYLIAGNGNVSTSDMYASASEFQKQVFRSISSLVIRKHTIIITK